MSRKKIKLIASLAVTAVAGVSMFVSQTDQLYGAANTPQAPAAPAAPPAAQQPAPAAGQAAAPAVDKAKTELPNEQNFKPAVETASLRLLVDSTSGHFMVEDKRNGNKWRSFPNPATWNEETITGTWRNNLRSPIMLEYIDMANFKSQPKIISFIEDKGTLEGFQTTPTGFKVTFNFATSKFKIPIEVKLVDDYVETIIYDKEIKEEKLSLLNLKLYPTLGAEQSLGQEGYALIPDGSGALIDYKANKTNDKSIYRESVFGNDSAFFSERTARQEARMPIFGLKSEGNAFLAVLGGGAEYAKIFASPSGAFGSSNWATAEQHYRIKFFQNTSRKSAAGFYTYNKQPFITEQRSVRYYLLDKKDASYVGMATKYREYLMKENSLKPITPKTNKVPMYVDLMAGDIKKGLFWDKYLKGTSTSEAMEIVKRLYGLGVENMSIGYTGFQDGGYTSQGGQLTVDKRLGGENGLKQFINFAHSLQLPVQLAANYTLNNNSIGFNDRYEGMRNLAGRVNKFLNFSNNEEVVLVSPKYSQVVLNKDLPSYKELGADGINFEDGIGKYLGSDFNEDYLSNRTQSVQTQKEMLKSAVDTLGSFRVDEGNFYTLMSGGHINKLPDDYSHDLFVDRAVPFAHIALHGLISYTGEYANLRDQYKNEFLRSIEYGANPSFVFTNAESIDMKGAYWVWYYSMNYKDWESKAVEEYQRFNTALGDVQGKFITGHKQLAPNVFETTYDGGKRIIVNYNLQSYSGGGISVPAQDFIVVNGGGSK